MIAIYRNLVECTWNQFICNNNNNPTAEKLPESEFVHTATTTGQFSWVWCHQLLTSKMGIIALNGGVHMATTFGGWKIAVAATVWTNFQSSFTLRLQRHKFQYVGIINCYRHKWVQWPQTEVFTWWWHFLKMLPSGCKKMLQVFFARIMQEYEKICFWGTGI